MQSLLPLGDIKQGIPALLNPALDLANTVSLVVSDAQIIANMFTAHVAWGIYDGVALALLPDSIVALDVKKEYNLPNYPMEDGAFQSYNKVKEPYDIRVKMSIGGNSAKLDGFLKMLDGVVSSLTLYSIVTPDATYPNANVHHYDFQRTATNGRGLLTVTLWAKEVRTSIVAAFAHVKVPDAVNPKAAQVSPTLPRALTPAEFAAIAV